ncbi:uncharacterized protein LOC123710832 isoform X1 [Pieris brassicae]|uniref:Uncharacterized protein n=1 Tax=Pieris brassicae TaxID=7116 RepID=A0A9P0XHN3_PIEBR|nr:uncharacterized protein LOC123710832 isoform X1 [Pieris brassicae]CAH4034801.1 unnamed protein product [Pieris brassicae]
MIQNLITFTLYSAGFFSLVIVDYLLGNGFVDMFERIACKIICFVRKTIREEEKLVTTSTDAVISIPFLLTEVLLLGFSIAFLNKYKQMRFGEKIDELLKDSRDALRETNEFIEKWRLRRLNWQSANEYTYLDEEPQEIKPYELEVPILHMAIIDTLGTTRSQPERGDAGDTINITDSTLLSVTSLLDDDYESVAEPTSDENINFTLEKSLSDFKDRFLWDVMEEDE